MSGPARGRDAAVRRELDDDARSERWLIAKALIALALVAAVIVLRELFV